MRNITMITFKRLFFGMELHVDRKIRVFRYRKIPFDTLERPFPSVLSHMYLEIPVDMTFVTLKWASPTMLLDMSPEILLTRCGIITFIALK